MFYSNSGLQVRATLNCDTAKSSCKIKGPVMIHSKHIITSKSLTDF